MGTRLTLLESVRRMIDEEDSTNSHFQDDEIYDYINQAIRYMGTDLEWPIQLAQATAVEGQAVYTLPTDFISLSDIYFNNNPMFIIDRTDLKSIQANWQDAENGNPVYAYKQDNRKFGLFPKPSAESLVSDDTIQIQYIKLPPDLDDDTDIPDLHLAFQDALPFYAAFLCETKVGNDKRATLRFDQYEMHKKRLTARLQKFSDDIMRFRWPRG